MNKDLLTYLSHSFCNNCCGEEKKFDCDTKQTTCVRLAQFLIDCNKYSPNMSNKEKLISQKIGKYASACFSSFDVDKTEDMTNGYADGIRDGYKLAKEE